MVQVTSYVWAILVSIAYALRDDHREHALNHLERALDSTLHSSAVQTHDKVETSSKISKDSFEYGGGLAAVGFMAMCFGANSIYRTKKEMKMIKDMEKMNTTSQSLQRTVQSQIPSVVIVKGTLSADGGNVSAAAPNIHQLEQQVGRIDQPENMLLDLTKAVKESKKNGKSGEKADGLSMGMLEQTVAAKTAIKAEDIPDVDTGFMHRQVDFNDQEGCVLTEILVSRLSVGLSAESKENQTGKTGDVTQNEVKEVTRNERESSYEVFHARNESKGLHLLDTNGTRINLQLPNAAVELHGKREPPSLFLCTNDAFAEIGAHADEENSEHVPDVQSIPATIMSKFAFMDVQSEDDLGLTFKETSRSVTSDGTALKAIADAYGRDDSFLWEPKGFYDFGPLCTMLPRKGENQPPTAATGYVCKGEDPPLKGKEIVHCVPDRATFKEREFVSADEFLLRAKTAASENPRISSYCEPTFTRGQLPSLRDKENCFRFSELAIPRNTQVTIVGRPVPNKDGGFILVPPNETQTGRPDSDPTAVRFRFRILQGHNVDNLLKQREANLAQYYGIMIAGVFMFLGGGSFLIVF